MSDNNKLHDKEGVEENNLNTNTPEASNLANNNSSENEVSQQAEDATSVEAKKTEVNNKLQDEKAPTAQSENDEVLNEIEESNAEDAEDEGNKERHKIEVKDYDSMSLEALAIELEKLIKNEKTNWTCSTYHALARFVRDEQRVPRH